MSPRPVRRKIAAATWRAPAEGRIHARTVVDVSAALAHVDHLRETTGERVTLLHLVGAALGRALRAVPEARARVVLGRVVRTDDCTVAFAVDVADGLDLGPVRVQHADRATTVEVTRSLSASAATLRRAEDRHHRRTSALVRVAPWWVMRPVMATASVLVGGFGVPAFGQPGRPLGTAFVSNVGSLGLDEAFLAPAPFARTAVYLAVGAVRDRPVAVHGEVVVRPTVVLVATADHRIVDGAHAGRLQRVLVDLLADPAALDVAG
ncbi:2-oxo acid dehydrogenase subunit E2 [Phycicoccus sp. BSK3Z-2]|uniref:2-oxo acid dehydrogenase subunit E2 n=1 Tax=Phycicoccus avicenniae TaxID=2828860 RepID=A0A941HZU8_9MICO|nr:2-oxo acid dehydrogenase subunit E2 [Phycicoccus avicenniae]MBR7742534.1 2-oxo acid dehydrogenase subunit E2 [Phycicoccus avicenniae]